MNLDLIKKLIRLANNNPNDNEANLAARKACRLIEEGKFNFNELKPVRIDNITPPPQQATTWNDVKRSTEPEFKSSRQHNPNSWTGFKFSQAQQDFFDRYMRRDWETPKYTPPSSYSPFTSDRNEPPKPKEKRPLECTKCHKTVDTAYVGNLFVCTTCVWDEYKQRTGL